MAAPSAVAHGHGHRWLMLRLMLAATAAVDNADGVRLPTTTIAQHRTI
jgi:hypothetical protein